MRKVNKQAWFGLLISFSVIGLVSNAIAKEVDTQNNQKTQYSSNKNLLVMQDVLSDEEADAVTGAKRNRLQPPLNDEETDLGDNSDNDANNDYNSDKETEAENTAPIPNEEEDNPLLDEEGNLTMDGQKNSLPQANLGIQQNNQSPQNPPSAPFADVPDK